MPMPKPQRRLGIPPEGRAGAAFVEIPVRCRLFLRTRDQKTPPENPWVGTEGRCEPLTILRGQNNYFVIF